MGFYPSFIITEVRIHELLPEWQNERLGSYYVLKPPRAGAYGHTQTLFFTTSTSSLNVFPNQNPFVKQRKNPTATGRNKSDQLNPIGVRQPTYYSLVAREQRTTPPAMGVAYQTFTAAPLCNQTQLLATSRPSVSRRLMHVFISGSYHGAKTKVTVSQKTCSESTDSIIVPDSLYCLV